MRSAERGSIDSDSEERGPGNESHLGSLDYPESPGSYPFKDGTINIRQQEIDVWNERPDALFTVSGFRAWTGRARYALGK